jgi:hypothetical protein
MNATARQRTAVRIGVLGVFLVLVLAGCFYIATTRPTPDSYYPKCVMHQLTGLHCPGCGTGRATYLLLQGRPLDALRCNLFSPILLPLLTVVCGRALIIWSFDLPDQRRRRRAVWARLLVALLICYGIARNIPAEPFSLLAPPEFDPVSGQLVRS